MALTTLLFRRQKTIIDSLELDASLTETHGIEVEVTDHPVEQGVNITDHRRVKPRQVVIEGLITNTPLPKDSDPLRSQTLNGVTWQSRSAADPARVGEALSTLALLAESDQLISIVTSLTSYENMTLTNLTIPRDASTGQSLRFTATFREIRIVTNDTVTLAKTTRAKKEVKEHTKPVTAVADDRTELQKLTAYRLSHPGDATGFMAYKLELLANPSAPVPP